MVTLHDFPFVQRETPDMHHCPVASSDAVLNRTNREQSSRQTSIYFFLMQTRRPVMMKLPLLHHPQWLSLCINSESLPVVHRLVCLFFFLKRCPLVPHYCATAQIASFSRWICFAETWDASVIQLPDKIKPITSCPECHHNDTFHREKHLTRLSIQPGLYNEWFLLFFFYWHWPLIHRHIGDCVASHAAAVCWNLLFSSN